MACALSVRWKRNGSSYNALRDFLDSVSTGFKLHKITGDNCTLGLILALIGAATRAAARGRAHW